MFSDAAKVYLNGIVTRFIDRMDWNPGIEEQKILDEIAVKLGIVTQEALDRVDQPQTSEQGGAGE